MKPPFRYYGGKTRLAAKIAALLPAHDHYVEPFAGSLAVLLAKPRSKAETVNDLDGDLVTFWRVLRDRPADLIRAAEMTPYSRIEFRAASDLGEHLDDLERARRVWVALSQGRAGRMTQTGWRLDVSVSAGLTMPGYLDAYIGRMPECAERLRGVVLEARPAADLIREYGKHENALLYCDPPYLGETRTAGYRHEMLGADEHRSLADALNGCRAAVVLSGYASPLYVEMFAGWHWADFETVTTNGHNYKRTEILWSNRPFGRAA